MSCILNKLRNVGGRHRAALVTGLLLTGNMYNLATADREPVERVFYSVPELKRAITDEKQFKWFTPVKNGWVGGFMEAPYIATPTDPFLRDVQLAVIDPPAGPQEDIWHSLDSMTSWLHRTSPKPDAIDEITQHIDECVETWMDTQHLHTLRLWYRPRIRPTVIFDILTIFLK
eukprot:TRINITY_DN9306_c0_g1_i1.p1 TRINITY_DN9306_c0_g1~~TRINITY_DN9306_c0_g1_i1.p1  ORF type:complete len:173 (-),score=7.57 TRINITY_DN9306_c0_g1_i1:207-725(-)